MIVLSLFLFLFCYCLVLQYDEQNQKSLTATTITTTTRNTMAGKPVSTIFLSDLFLLHYPRLYLLLLGLLFLSSCCLLTEFLFILAHCCHDFGGRSPLTPCCKFPWVLVVVSNFLKPHYNNNDEDDNNLCYCCVIARLFTAAPFFPFLFVSVSLSKDLKGLICSDVPRILFCLCSIGLFVGLLSPCLAPFAPCV